MIGKEEEVPQAQLSADSTAVTAASTAELTAASTTTVKAATQPGFYNNVTIRPYTYPSHYLFVANDGTRQYNSDYDVRTHDHIETRNNFIIEYYGDGIIRIRHSISQFWVFPADDGSRSFNGDYDVRAHLNDEDRNYFQLIATAIPGVYLIKLTTNPDQPDQYVFPATDGTNKYGSDFDVRCHPNVEARNQWIFTGFSL